MNYTVHLGDCVKWAKRMEDNSIDYSVFSPPFADLFTYSNSDHVVDAAQKQYGICRSV